MKKNKGYKAAMRDLVHQIGADYVDRMAEFLYSTDKLPVWLITLAVSFNKKPLEVAKDIIRYRNSMMYQYKIMGIR